VDADVVLEAGEWPVPPLDVGTDANLTVVGGRAQARSALLRAGAVVPSIIDIEGGGELTLRDLTVESGLDETVHSVVRQDVAVPGHVTLEGVRTADRLDHLLLLQWSDASGDGTCPVQADAVVAASDSGPAELDVDAGGVVAATWCVLDGIPQVGAEDFAVGAAALKIERTRLTGDMSGRTVTTDGVPVHLAPVQTPASVELRESLWTGLSVSDHPALVSLQSVTVDSLLAADLAVADSSVLEAPSVSIDRSLLCDIAGDGVLVALSGGEEPALVFGRSSLTGLDMTLASGPPLSPVTLDNLTLTRSTEGPLVAQELFPTVRNVWMEGAWTLPDLRDADGDVVEGLRLVGSACPGSLGGCQTVEASGMSTAVLACADVFDTYFRQESSVAAWPTELRELARLEDPSPCADALLGAPSEATDAWGCGVEPPPRIGAWPGEDCGLPLLAYDTTPAPDCVDPDSGAPGSTAGSDSGLEWGGTCQGRHAGIFLVLLSPLIVVRQRLRRGLVRSEP